MNYLQAVSFVDNLDEFRYRFGLNRIKKFLKKSGNPQNKLNIIHVAGSNGKGSVCTYISTILQRAGYKVGLYTSPHLLDIRERIQINRKIIPKHDFANFITHYTSHITQCSLTYFELLTAMAFWYFGKEKVNFAVMEVGLGGRLDATNVIKNPLVSVITSISPEHTQYLGNTIEKIAKEKAGIIKKNGTVITAETAGILRVIKNIAEIKNAKVIHLAWKKYNNYTRLPAVGQETLLFGEHQKQNANLAVECCRHLNIQEKHIIAGLKNTHLPGRFEIRQLKMTRSLPDSAGQAGVTLSQRRRVSNLKTRFFARQGGVRMTTLKIVLDVAHNPAGMVALHNSIKKYFGKKVNFVFSVLEDKDYKKMIKIISPAVKNIFISAVKNNRALPPKTAESEFLKHIPKENIFIYGSVKNAVKSAISGSEDFCITGSTYTVAEGMESLRKQGKNRNHPLKSGSKKNRTQKISTAL